MKFNNMGINISISETRLPGKIDIMALFFSIIWLMSILDLLLFSSKGWPTNLQLIFSFSKYFFSNLNNSKIWSINFFIFFTRFSLHTHTCGATKWIVFIFFDLFLTISATLNVKSGLSTENKISGSNSIILFAVSLIFFFILKMFVNTFVKPRYVTSFKLNIDSIPIFFKFSPPRDRYWILLVFFLV